MFCYGDAASISVLIQTLDRFYSYARLRANTRKSTCYLLNTEEELPNWIENSYGIEIRSLPAKFLGVPLITKKLSFQDC